MRRTLAAFVLAAVFLASFVSPALAAGARSISLSASRFDFDASAGQTGVGTVWVNNEGDEDLSIRVYAANQVLDQKGDITYVAPAVDANVLQSPASWVTLELPPQANSVGNVPYVPLKARGRVKVVFHVKIPDGAVPGDHSILLFFEMFNPPDARRPSAGTTVFGRLGARIKARVAGQVIEDVDAAPFAMPSWVLGAKVPYAFTLNNRGNVDERATVRLVELDRDDAEVGSSDVLTDTPVYAGSQLQRSGHVKGSGFGKPHFKLVVTYPSADASASGLVKTAEKDRYVWVLPAWLPYAIGIPLVVIMLLALWLTARSAGRREALRVARDRARELGASQAGQGSDSAE